MEREKAKNIFKKIEKAALVPVLAATIALSGCESYPPITDGVIIEKDYDPAYYFTYFIDVNDIKVPIITYYPESWEITIEKDVYEEYKLVHKKRSFEVSEEEYNKLQIGQRVDFSETK